MALPAVISEKESPANLPDFGGAHYDASRLRLDLEEFLDCRQHADKVSVEHALEYAGQAEDGQEHLFGGKRLETGPRETRAESAKKRLLVLFFFIVSSVMGNVSAIQPFDYRLMDDTRQSLRFILFRVAVRCVHIQPVVPI